MFANLPLSLLRVCFGLGLGAMATAAVGETCGEGHTGELEIRYAKNFTVEAYDGYRILTVMHAFQGCGDLAFKYVLYPRGQEQPLPPLQGDFAYVEVPLKRAIVLSTTFLSGMDVVDAIDSIVGVGAFSYVNTESVLDRIRSGGILEVGSETSKNIELMISLDPEVVFTNIVGNSDYDVHPMLNEMGIVSAVTAGYMERTALGRAEWIKFLGLFYDKDAEAAAFFDRIEQRYLMLKQLVEHVDHQPTILANAPWGNNWYVPSGKSYLAGMLEDAGANYLWKELQTEGSLPLDFESVYERAIDADFWINTAYLNTMDAVAQQDERYLDFKSVKEGNVYSETLRVSPLGGNDIWERGSIHPEEILADYIKMFHPDLLPDHEFIYFKKVSEF